MRTQVAMLALLLAATVPSHAEDSKAELARKEQFARQWHKEHDEEIRNAGKAIDALAALSDAASAASDSTHKQCLRIIGNNIYCKCVADNNPVALNFVGFVMVNAFEEGAQELSDITMEVVVNARLAKQKCDSAPRKSMSK